MVRSPNVCKFLKPIRELAVNFNSNRVIDIYMIYNIYKFQEKQRTKKASLFSLFSLHNQLSLEFCRRVGGRWRRQREAWAQHVQYVQGCSTCKTSVGRLRRRKKIVPKNYVRNIRYFWHDFSQNLKAQYNFSKEIPLKTNPWNFQIMLKNHLRRIDTFSTILKNSW